jgi:hypothetical protein
LRSLSILDLLPLFPSSLTSCPPILGVLRVSEVWAPSQGEQQPDVVMEQHALTTDKTPYELARDKRVAEIAKAFLPIEIACADL